MEENIENSPILIVDDEAANVLLLERILEEDGFNHIHSTVDPQEGLYLFKQKDIQLVVLDIEMPDMNGFDFLKQLARPKKSPFPPVLILTAHSDEQTKLRAFEAGAQDFLGKPFSIPEALCRIRNLLHLTQYHHQLMKQSVIVERLVREKTFELTQKIEQMEKERDRGPTGKE